MAERLTPSFRHSIRQGADGAAWCSRPVHAGIRVRVGEGPLVQVAGQGGGQRRAARVPAMRRVTGVWLWVLPMPMWWSLPLWRSELPQEDQRASH